MSEQPSTNFEQPKPVDALQSKVKELASQRVISRDQEKVLELTLQDSSFALLANRALVQGADPEFLRQTASEAFLSVASRLNLSLEDANDAIESAHTKGPGSLAVDSAKEWLWLIMAKFSLDEASKPNEPAKVMAASARMLVAFEDYAGSATDVEVDARAYRAEMLAKVQPVGIAPQGKDIPLYENDRGFYAAYRNEKHAAAVRTKDGLVFYGTDSSVSLDDLGIKVDKTLSPFFGIVFPQK